MSGLKGGQWKRAASMRYRATDLPMLSPKRVRAALLRHDAGQSIVELALMLPLLAFVLIGGADVARAYAVQLAVQNGARAGAEAAATQRTPTEADAKAHAQQEMGRTPGLDATQANITMTILNKNGNTCTVQPPTPQNPCFATVRVQYTFRTAVPWPLIPNVFTFDRSTTMRIFW